MTLCASGLKLFEDSAGAASPAFYGCMALVMLAVVGAIGYYIRYRRRFRAAMIALGLQSTGDQLPGSFPEPSSPWQIGAKVVDCYAGLYNQFEAFTCRLRVGAGRDVTYRYLVAVKRTGFQPRSSLITNNSIRIDSTSAAGWTIASANGSYPSAFIVQSLFGILTAQADGATTQPSSL